MVKKKSAIESSFASELATEMRMVFRQLKRRLRDQADVGDLTNSQISALIHIESAGPTTISDLARAEGIRSQSMGSTVAALESAGLIEGAADPEDGRRTIYSWTKRCRELFESGRAARQDWLVRVITEKLTPDDQMDLMRAMALLKRLVET